MDVIVKAINDPVAYNLGWLQLTYTPSACNGGLEASSDAIPLLPGILRCPVCSLPLVPIDFVVVLLPVGFGCALLGCLISNQLVRPVYLLSAFIPRIECASHVVIDGLLGYEDHATHHDAAREQAIANLQGHSVFA